MSAGWIAAGAVSFVAHVGFAAWVDNTEPKAKPLRDVEMTVTPLKVKAPEPPKPLPPPPPPEPKKPVLVKKPIKQQPPAPAPTKRIGVEEAALAPASDIAAPAGVDNDGIAGTGNSMDKDLPPPPPEPPTPPAPPPIKKVKFLPAFQVDVMPKMKHAAQPEIPAAFRDAQREAVVVIEVEIDITGKVVGARVLKHADYGLDDAALAAAKQTTFEPARMQNQPVPVRYQIPYRFKVRG